MLSKVNKLITLSSLQPVKAVSDLDKKSVKEQIDTENSVKDAISHGAKFSSGNKVLKQFMSSQVLMFYNVCVDDKQKGIKRLTVYSYDKQEEDNMTIKELAKIVTDGFKTTNDRIDTIEAKVDGIDTRLTSLEAKVDGIDTRLTSLEKKVDDGFKEVNDRLDVLENQAIMHG